MLFGILVVLRKVYARNFKALSHNSVDYHSLFWACFSDRNSKLIYISIIGCLFLFLLILLFSFLTLIKVGRWFDIWEYSNRVLSISFSQINECILFSNYPFLLSEILLKLRDFSKIALLSLYFLYDDWDKNIEHFLEFSTITVIWFNE